jgi:hypothetical protein
MYKKTKRSLRIILLSWYLVPGKNFFCGGNNKKAGIGFGGLTVFWEYKF